MKNIIKILLPLMVMLTGCASNQAQSTQGNEVDNGKLKISIVQYAQHPALDDANAGFKNALEENGYGTDKVTLDDYNAQNDASNVETIATTVINNQPDLIFGIATPVAQGIASKTDTIPLVISAVTDPAQSGLVNSNEQPGNNVTGTSDQVNGNVMVELLFQLLPDVKQVGIMYCSSEDNSKIQAAMLTELLTAQNITVKEFTAADSSSVQAVAQSASGQVDAMLIPTDNLMAECMPLVADVLNNSGIVSIVGEPSLVENGGTVSKGIDYHQLGYQAGLMAIEIMEGKNPSEMPIYFTSNEDLSLAFNQTSLNATGLQVEQNLLDSATIYE